MDWYPLTFEPILKPKTWGGQWLATTLGKDLPPGTRIGESWEVSDFPGDVSIVAEGPLAGRSLHDLVETEAPWLLGRRLRPAEGGRFPLLAKFIDAGEYLSVQVHPDEGAARRLGPEARAKSECWYVLEADPGGAMYLGVRPGVSREALREAFEAGDRERIEALLNVLEVRAGDFLYAPAGTIHAIGAGMLFAEVSQTSDSTLRLYDWGRLPRRPTHIEVGLEAVDLPPDGLGRAGLCDPVAIDDYRDRLLECAAFTVERVDLLAGERLRLEEAGLSALWMTVAGRAEMAYPGGVLDLSPGRTCLLPAGPRRVDLKAQEDLRVLIYRPPA